MRLRLRPVAFLVASCAAVTAGALVACANLGGLSGGAADGADGSTTDAGTTPTADAAPDASTGDAGSTWCAQNAADAAFCADFEAPTKWGGENTLLGSLRIAPGLSPPNAMATLTWSTDGGNAAAARYVDLDVPRGEATFAFDMLIESGDTRASAVAWIQTFDSGGKSTGEVWVQPDDSGATVTLEWVPPGAANTTSAPLAAIAQNVWTRMSLTLRRTPNEVDAIVGRDGKNVTVVLVGLSSLGTRWRFTAGDAFTHGPWKMRFDDVVVDTP